MINSKYFIFILTLSSTLPFTTLSKPLSYAPVVVCYAIIVVEYLLSREIKLAAPKFALYPIILIWTIFVIHVFFHPFRGEVANFPIVRTPIFILVSAINLFILPKMVQLEDFLSVLATSTSFLVILGLPSYFFNFSVFGIEVALHPGIHDLINVNLFSSIFTGPNAFSRFVVSGVFASLALIPLNKNYTVTFCISTLGVFLASSRATMALCLLGLILYAIFLLFGRWIFLSTSIIGGVGGVFLLLSILNIVPAPDQISNINPSGRNVLWRAGVNAWKQAPWIGTGPINTADPIRPFLEGTRWQETHVHNSYIRILITTGLLGFVPYVYLHLRSLLAQTIIANDSQSLGLLLLAIVYTGNQVTNVFSLFGLSATSIISSLTFGYILLAITEHGYSSKTSLFNGSSESVS